MPSLAPRRRRVLLIAPLAPAPAGNGLAMRAALALDGLARACDVYTAIVPVSDPTLAAERTRWAAERSVGAVCMELERPTEAARGWLDDPRARALTRAVEPLPTRARSVSPACGRAIRKRFDGVEFDAVWLHRLYLAGAALPFLDVLPKPRLILDADDDDAATARSLAAAARRAGDGDAEVRQRAEADAADRLAAQCLPWFDRVFTASPAEGRALAERHGLATVASLPNAVAIPPQQPARRPRPDELNLVFVGNLDYAPNRLALARLAHRILPELRIAVPRARLHVVGEGSAAGIAGLDGVVLHGALAALDAVYRDADLALVPLEAGGGSRLKLLEAFAHGVPVITTPEGAAGLAVRDGVELLVASDDPALVAAAVRVHADPELAHGLVRRAREFVTRHHDRAAVTRGLAQLAGLAT